MRIPTSRSLAATFAAAVFVAGGAVAQDANTLDDQFPAVTPGAAANQGQPQEVVRETHGAWEIRCAEGTSSCYMAQFLGGESGAQVARLSLIKMPLGSEVVAGATLLAPLGTVLTRGAAFNVDEGEMGQTAFGWCTPVGCYSRFGLKDLTVEEMKAGSSFNVTVYAINDMRTPITVSASLEGFTAAFDALEPLQNAQ